MLSYRPTVVEINLDNYAHNLREIRKLIGNDVKLMSVLKGNASGLGAVELAKVARETEADYFAVAFVDEGIELRKEGIDLPILVFGAIPDSEIEQAINYDLSLTLTSIHTAKIISDLAVKKRKEVKVHIKVDTGMNRIGVRPREVASFAKEVQKLPNIVIEGVYTHFATAHRKDKSFAEEQFKRYQSAIEDLEDAGILIPLRHVANSGATLCLPHMYLDMVRSSAATLSFPPSDEIYIRDRFKPVVSLKTEVVFVKEIPAGCGISYDHTFITERKSTIATLPMGYGDGYPASISNKGKVLINGEYAPIVGRICMDQMMVDVTDISDVKVGDEVVLIGTQGENTLTPEEVGAWAGMIHAELTCRISERVPRVYIKDGKIFKKKSFLLERFDNDGDK